MSCTARWASRCRTGWARRSSAPTIYGYYADHAEEFLADEPIALLDGEGTAVSGAYRSA